MAAFSPCWPGLVAPVWPLVNAISGSREQFAATTTESAQPGEGAALRLGRVGHILNGDLLDPFARHPGDSVAWLGEAGRVWMCHLNRSYVDQ